MNIPNLMKLRDHFAQLADSEAPSPGVGFNMMDFAATNVYSDRSPHHCGTTCCIGGHAALIAGFHHEGTIIAVGGIEQFASKWLGLTCDESCNLFYAQFRDKKTDFEDITPKDVLAVLNHMIQYGEVPLNGNY